MKSLLENNDADQPEQIHKICTMLRRRSLEPVLRSGSPDLKFSRIVRETTLMPASLGQTLDETALCRNHVLVEAVTESECERNEGAFSTTAADEGYFNFTSLNKSENLFRIQANFSLEFPIFLELTFLASGTRETR